MANMKEVLLSIEIEKLPEGVFLATSKDLPGLIVQANSIAEALDIAQDAAQKLIESYREHGDPLPPAMRKKIQGSEQIAVKLRIPVTLG